MSVMLSHVPPPIQALVDGPAANVRRQAISFSKLCLTDFKISISRSAREKQVRKAYGEADIATKWEQTAWCRRINRKAKRQQLTDFDRFKLRVLRQQVCCHKLALCDFGLCSHRNRASSEAKSTNSRRRQQRNDNFISCEC